MTGGREGKERESEKAEMGSVGLLMPMCTTQCSSYLLKLEHGVK